MTETTRSWKAATRGYTTYAAYAPTWKTPAARAEWVRQWETTVLPSPTIPVRAPEYPSTAWPLGWGEGVEGVIIDHGRQVVIDARRNVQAEPKLIVELSGDEKDVIIQCRCGDRISLVKLLGIDAVKPIFDGISGRIRGLIEAMKPEQPAQP